MSLKMRKVVNAFNRNVKVPHHHTVKMDAERFADITPSTLKKRTKSELANVVMVDQGTQSDYSMVDSQKEGGDKIRLDPEEVGALIRLKSMKSRDSKASKASSKTKDDISKMRGNMRRDEMCSCVAKCCSLPEKGALKGIKRSIPRKTHIIEYWHKQLNNRIPKKKQAIVVGAHPELGITYQELDEFSNAVAHNLMQTKFSGKFTVENPNNEIIIAMCHPPCYEYMVILLAILKLGAAILPISFDAPASRIAEIIKLTKPVLTIVASSEDDLFDTVQGLVDFDTMRVDDIWDMLYDNVGDKKTMKWLKEPIQSPDPAKPFPPMWKRTVAIAVVPSDTQELQALSYDSRAFLNRIDWENHYFIYISSEHVLSPPNVETVDDIAEVLTPLCIGCTLVVLETPIDFFVPDQLLQYCQTYKLRRITVWPSLLKTCLMSMQLYDNLVQRASTVRYWFCVGGFLRSELADMFFEIIPNFTQLIHCYHYEDCVGGLAFQIYETNAVSQGRSYYSRLPVGYPVPNMDIYVMGPDLKPVPDGETGEICLAGLQLPVIPDNQQVDLTNTYYFKNPMSNRGDKKLLIRTMDLGRIIKRKGRKILVYEIMQAACKHCYVENKIVWLLHVEKYFERLKDLITKFHLLCYRPNEDDQIILAFCILAKGATTEKVEEELMQCLPVHMLPEIVSVEQIPLQTSCDPPVPDENLLIRYYQEKKQEGLVYTEWGKTGLTVASDLRAAKVLAFVIHSFLGIPVSDIVEKWWLHPFLRLKHASVAKGCSVVRELHRNRYPVYTDDVVFCENLCSIIDRMLEARNERGFYNRNCPPDEVLFIKNRFRLEIMIERNRVLVCNLLAKSFTRRDQLDYFAEVSMDDMKKYFDSIWPMFVAKNLSLILRVKQANNRLVGAVLNMNWHDEIQLKTSLVPRQIAYKLELIEYLEKGLTDSHFPQDKTHVLQVCYIGLDSSLLTNYEIHGLTDKVIRSMLIIGKLNGFEALVIITYEYYALDICVNSYHFEVARQCQVNQFIASDGTKPYALSPDSLVATLCWKHFSKIEEADLQPRSTEHRMSWYHTIAKHMLAQKHKKPWTGAK